jgi:hypothetical protein
MEAPLSGTVVGANTLHFILNASSCYEGREAHLSNCMAMGRWLNRLLAIGCKQAYLREGIVFICVCTRMYVCMYLRISPTDKADGYFRYYSFHILTSVERRYRTCVFFSLVSWGLCGLLVRVPGYKSRGPGSIPGTTRFSEK